MDSIDFDELGKKIDTLISEKEHNKQCEYETIDVTSDDSTVFIFELFGHKLYFNKSCFYSTFKFLHIK